MAISPGMIKILGSIASSAMSNKGKEESKPEPKLNSNFLIDADKQAAPLNLKLFNKIGSSVSNIFKPGKNKQTRLIKRNQNRLDRAKRVDTDPLTNDYVKGSGAGGTDVGNFFRRMKNPAAPQTPPSTTNTNNPQNNYEETKKESNNKLNSNYNIGLMDPNWKNKQFDGYANLDHKQVALAKLKKNK